MPKKLALDDLVLHEEAAEEVVEEVVTSEEVVAEPALPEEPASQETEEISWAPATVDVVSPGVDVRMEPSSRSRVLARLARGTHLVKAGPPITVGSTKWQPVIFYVASEKNGRQLVQ